MTRYLVGFIRVLALGVMPVVGCGGMGVCEGVECNCQGVECDDGNECTEDICADGVCDYAPVENRVACGDGPGACEAGICVGGVFACTEQGIRDAVAVGGGPHS